MTPENLNRLLKEIINSLNIIPEQIPDWSVFLQFILDETHSQQANLEETASGSVHSLKRHSDSIDNTGQLVIPLESSTLTLFFNDQFSADNVTLKFQPLWPHLSNILNIARAHEEKVLQNRWKKMSNDVFPGFSWELDPNGMVISQKVNKTDTASHVTISRKGIIALTLAPGWIKEKLPDLTSGKIPGNLIQHYFSDGDKQWIAYLHLTINDKDSWIYRPAQIRLSIMPTNLTNQSWLTEKFSLSDSESQVLTLYAGGQSADQIAKTTGYSVNTVNSYIQKYYKKLGVNKQSQLAAIVWKQLL